MSNFDGCNVAFDFSKISAAIMEAFEATMEIDHEIDALDFMCLSREEYEQARVELEERRREANRNCKGLVQKLNAVLCQVNGYCSGDISEDELRAVIGNRSYADGNPEG